MSKTPKFDAKIQSILDALQPCEQTCELTGETWMMDEQEIATYRKHHVPPGGLSPQTKRKHLSLFATAFQFWWNKHFDTGKPVLSFHHPGSGVRVLPDKEWFERDFTSENLPFDASKPTFDLVRTLQIRVPYLATCDINESENSITLLSFGDVNSYFMLGCRSKNSFFSTCYLGGENSSLVLTSTEVHNSHFIAQSSNVFNSRYIFHSSDIMDSAFLNDCRDCRNCFGGMGLRRREYVFFNEQLSKSEYEAKMKEIDLGNRSEVETWMKVFDEMVGDSFWPESFNFQVENSSGEYLSKSVNCVNHFFALPTAVDCYECAYTFGDINDCAYLWGAGAGAANQYQVVTSSRANNLKFCMRCQDSNNLEYCLQCLNCENCFGCVGLNRKQFCIFNKQYTEEEYWEKVDELKCAMLDRGEYGNFFPATFATAYQPEGGLLEYCTGTVEDLPLYGVNEFDMNAENAAGMDGLDVSSMKTSADIPDSIDDLSDSWIGQPIYDPVAGRKFGFLKPEIEHYRKLRIAPPTKHYVWRMRELDHSIHSCIREERTCEKTGVPLMTQKNLRWPNRKVICMDAYHQYISERN